MSAHFIKGVAILAGVFVVIPVVLFFVLRRLVRPLIRAQEGSAVNPQITPTGFIFYGLQVLFMVVCPAAYSLDPQGRLGGLLHTTDGIVGAILIFTVGGRIGESALRRAGYPVVRSKVDRNI